MKPFSTFFRSFYTALLIFGLLNVPLLASDQEDEIFSPSFEPARTQPKTRLVTFKDEGSAEQGKEQIVKTGAFIVEQIQFISKTLQLIDAAVLLEEATPQEQEHHGAEESAVMKLTTLEKPGDIHHGLFLMFESLRRPHRYHAKFYRFDEEAYITKAEVFLTEKGEEQRNKILKKLLRAPQKVDLAVEVSLLAQTAPNKLLLSCEEKDARRLGRVRDIFGKLYSKVEEDPLKVLALLVGGASRIAKAVLTNGASELANLTS